MALSHPYLQQEADDILPPYTRFPLRSGHTLKKAGKTAQPFLLEGLVLLSGANWCICTIAAGSAVPIMEAGRTKEMTRKRLCAEVNR